YHPLFRVFLRSRLHSSFRRDEILSLKRQAAGILADSGDIEDAAELLRDTEQWDDLIRIILGQAQSLVQQGRTQTLNNLLKGIPEELTEEVPWLTYWNGVCRLLVAP